MALREQTQRLLSQEDVTADNVEEMYGIEGIDLPDITAKDVAMFGAEMLPGVGEALALKRTSDALDEKDYVGAGIEATAGLLGLVPGVGDAAGKAFRASANALRTPKWFKETKVDINLAPDSSRKTQITTTTPTYRKVRDLLPEGKTLDFGSGKGIGAREVGFDTYEPFPDADFTPNYSSAKEIPDESYENVTSLNVLNVVKPETRTEILTDIGRILKPGGTAIITTRGADVFGNAKNPVRGVLGDEPGSVITSSGTYQKGFTNAELKEYVQETLGEEFEVANISGAGQAGVKITKTKPASYDVDNPIFHATKGDFSQADLVPVNGDIGFHVGTSRQADFRLPVLPENATALQRKNYLEDAEGARVLKLALKSDLKPLRVPDIGQFKQPDSWLGRLAVDSSDNALITYLKKDPEDAALLASAPKVEVDGKTFIMNPEIRASRMPPEVWADLVTAAQRNKVLTQGSSTSATNIRRKADKQISKMRWFTDLKEALNKHGYDSVVYRNEYEGAFDMADSYMLMEPDQVKNVFGGMTPGDPDLNKNRGGLMMQEGGAVPMKEQMELFADGGLEQDGGTTDPVSGNDVPPGSSKEEVRDDIPAQLSEGEFVFPADVVRYIGLEKLMMMRQEAKMGLKMMEEMGQMGNADEATMPDDLPFGVTDLIIIDGQEDVDDDDKKEYNTGGVVYSDPVQQPQTNVFYQPPQYQSQPAQIGQAASPIQMAPVARPQQQEVPVYQPPETLPTPGEFFDVSEQAPRTITIVNKETGEERTITFIPGVTEIPEGFVLKEDYVPKEVVPQTQTATVGTATVREEDDDDKPDVATGATIAFGGSLNSRGRVEGSYLGNISYQGLGFGEARSRAIQGFSQFTNKNNVTPPLPEGATAIISNLQLPKDPGDIRPAEIMRARLQIDSDFFNKTIANTNVTDRRDLEKTVDYIRNKYKSNFLNDSDNIINVEQEFRQMQRDEGDAAARERLDEARRKQERGDDSGFDRIVEAAVKQATKEVERDYDDEAASSVSVSQAELDAAKEKIESDNLADDIASSYADESGAYTDYNFQQGGLAKKSKPKPKAKKMKRGGLASKK